MCNHIAGDWTITYSGPITVDGKHACDKDTRIETLEGERDNLRALAGEVEEEEMLAEPRPAVKHFASEMEAKLAENDDTKDPWEGESYSFLLGRLKDEVAELEKAMLDGNDCEIVRECADVANMAMMIADKRMGPHEDRGRALAGKEDKRGRS